MELIKIDEAVKYTATIPPQSTTQIVGDVSVKLNNEDPILVKDVSATPQLALPGDVDIRSQTQIVIPADQALATKSTMMTQPKKSLQLLADAADDSAKSAADKATVQAELHAARLYNYSGD